LLKIRRLRYILPIRGKYFIKKKLTDKPNKFFFSTSKEKLINRERKCAGNSVAAGFFIASLCVA
jgi:hypothetical protein